MASVVRTLKKVLIVDDNPAIRSEIHLEFNRHGFLCSNAENGRQAIEQVFEILPDLIILDLSMPVMDGLAAVYCEFSQQISKNSFLCSLSRPVGITHGG